MDEGFRILRSVSGDGRSGLLRQDFRDLLTPLQGIGEDLEGAVLSIGDLDADGLPEYVLTRAVPLGVGNQTRVIATDR